MSLKTFFLEKNTSNFCVHIRSSKKCAEFQKKSECILTFGDFTVTKFALNDKIINKTLPTKNPEVLYSVLKTVFL